MENAAVTVVKHFHLKTSLQTKINLPFYFTLKVRFIDVNFIKVFVWNNQNSDYVKERSMATNITSGMISIIDNNYRTWINYVKN